MGSKVTVADACTIVIYRNIALYRMSGFLLDMIIAQANYRDDIEIPVYRATLLLCTSLSPPLNWNLRALSSLLIPHIC